MLQDIQTKVVISEKKVDGHQIYCKKEGNGEGKRVEKNRRGEDDNPAQGWATFMIKRAT